MVYSALSDSTTRSQFTRRKDITITTDGTSTPTDYQVKLTITYEAEMQADFDDIRFNTRDGDYIDYWIESYTASTSAVVWVELPNAITDPGADIILMYYGNPNLSDGGVGDDTFMSHFDGNSTKWIEVDPNSHISFANNRLEWTGLDRDEDAYVYQANSNVNGDIIVEHTIYFSAISQYGFGLTGIVGDIVDDGANIDNSITMSTWYATGIARTQKRISDTPTDSGSVAFSVSTQYWVRTKIDRSGNATLQVYSDASKSTQVGSDQTLDISDVSATLDNVFLINTWNTATGSRDTTGWLDNFLIRKYIANEPTLSYGTAQHQRRIPQFIG